MFCSGRAGGALSSPGTDRAMTKVGWAKSHRDNSAFAATFMRFCPSICSNAVGKIARHFILVATARQAILRHPTAMDQGAEDKPLGNERVGSINSICG